MTCLCLHGPQNPNSRVPALIEGFWQSHHKSSKIREILYLPSIAALTSTPYSMTNAGLRITLSLAPGGLQDQYFALLNCPVPDEPSKILAIFLKRLSSNGDQYCRGYATRIKSVISNIDATLQTIYVRQQMPVQEFGYSHNGQAFLIRIHSSLRAMLGYSLTKIHPTTGSVLVSKQVSERQCLGVAEVERQVIALLFEHYDSTTPGSKIYILLGSRGDQQLMTRIVAYDGYHKLEELCTNLFLEHSQHGVRAASPSKRLSEAEILLRETGSGPRPYRAHRAYRNICIDQETQTKSGKKLNTVEIKVRGCG